MVYSEEVLLLSIFNVIRIIGSDKYVFQQYLEVKRVINMVANKTKCVRVV